MEMHVPAAVLEARHVPATQPVPTGIALSFSPQLSVHFDKDARAIWSRWAPEPRPCFNPALLADIRAYYEFLAASNGRIDCLGEEHDSPTDGGIVGGCGRRLQVGGLWQCHAVLVHRLLEYVHRQRQVDGAGGACKG